jgi:hypothetical protein
MAIELAIRRDAAFRSPPSCREPHQHGDKQHVTERVGRAHESGEERLSLGGPGRLDQEDPVRQPETDREDCGVQERSRSASGAAALHEHEQPCGQEWVGGEVGHVGQRRERRDERHVLEPAVERVAEGPGQPASSEEIPRNRVGWPVHADTHHDRPGGGCADKAVDEVRDDPERQRQVRRADHKANEQVPPPDRHHHTCLMGCSST